MSRIATLKSATPARRLSLTGILTFLIASHRIWRERQHLLRLEPSQLDDIGLSRDEAIAEAARPIWDVPPTWRV